MEKTLKVDIKVTEEQLSCLISNAISCDCGFAWWKYDKDKYKEAKAELESEGKSGICTEDIMARLLFKGGKLKLLDPESEWHWSGHEENELIWSCQVATEHCVPEGGEWHEVGLEDIFRGVELYAESHCANDCGADIRIICEYGDSEDADAVFQFAAYGDIIYG